MTRYYKTDKNGKILYDLPTLEDAIEHGCEQNAYEGELVYGWDGGLYLNEGDVPAKPDATRWAEIRAKRDGLLVSSDWTMVSDAPTDKAAWGAYRQALRDLPETQEDPFNIVWPEAPNQ